MGFEEKGGAVCLWWKQNRGNLVKEVSVTVLVQGKKMSSLLKLCESYTE